MFKERYAEKIERLVTPGVRFIKDVKLVAPKAQIGNIYHQPVVLTHEHGFTYAAASAGAFAVNTPVAAAHGDAQVTGAQVLLESRIDYESAHRAKKDGRAFADAMDHVVRNMFESMQRRVELEHLRGQRGVVRLLQRISGGGTATQVWSVALSTWSAGTLAGLEGAPVDILEGSTGSPGAKINTTTVAILASVDIANRRVTLTGTTADLDAITSDTAEAGDEDFLFFQGASASTEWAGLRTIISNTGTMFNIAGGVYSMWQGNTYDVGTAITAPAQLTMQKVFDAVDLATSRGLDESACLYVNPRTWSDLMGDLAALRKYDSSYQAKMGKNGMEALAFHSQNGLIEIEPHILMPEGEAYLFPKARATRLGSTDITFGVPDDPNGDIFYHLPSNAGYGLRGYTFQATFIPTPAKCALLRFIANS
jgi:hypothetical protein